MTRVLRTEALSLSEGRGQASVQVREAAASPVFSAADGCVGAPAGELESLDGWLWLQERLPPRGIALLPGPHPPGGPRSLQGGRSLIRLPGGSRPHRRDPHR